MLNQTLFPVNKEKCIKLEMWVCEMSQKRYTNDIQLYETHPESKHRLGIKKD